MILILLIGVIVGTMLYFTKLGLFYLATKPTPNLKKVIHNNTWLQIGLDTIFGILGMHVLTMAGGSVISMISMVTFGAWSMLYIFIHIGINKLTKENQRWHNSCSKVYWGLLH